MSSGPEDLVTREGVDEGSAASTAEPTATASTAAASTATASTAAASTDGDAGPDPDVLGEPPHGAPVDDAQAAEPVDMESGASRRARAERGPGQQLQEGEG